MRKLAYGVYSWINSLPHRSDIFLFIWLFFSSSRFLKHYVACKTKAQHESSLNHLGLSGKLFLTKSPPAIWGTQFCHTTYWLGTKGSRYMSLLRLFQKRFQLQLVLGWRLWHWNLLTLTLGLTMVICSLLASLRICLERHPPLVSFFFCLLSLAIAFVGFAVYIQSHDVQNPDVKEVS